MTMTGANRRAELVKRIETSDVPLSASFLGKEFGVTRQVIVGDVARLRSEGNAIIATARGYLFDRQNQVGYRKKIACCHSPEQTQAELYLLVDLGVYIENVMIEHEVYGELVGTLRLTSRRDVDEFMTRLATSSVKLLSELTEGVHLHTVICESQAHFEQVTDAMKNAGFLVT